jgi:short-subunit dehydrogenase
MTRERHTALITGASAGLGLEYAKLFAADGHDLVLVARRRDKLDELAATLAKEHKTTCTVIPADLQQHDAPRHIFDRLNEAGIELEFLVNNAGFGSNGAFAELELERELGMIDVNVRALVTLTRLVLPGMLARKHGRVLNIGSTAGFVAGPYMATYYASKAFVISFTEALAYELKGTGVTATVSCPGATATEFAAVAGNDKSALFKGGVADSASVARHGYRAMLAGKVIAIPGVKNKLTAQSVRFSPRSLIRSRQRSAARHPTRIATMMRTMTMNPTIASAVFPADEGGGWYIMGGGGGFTYC